MAVTLIVYPTVDSNTFADLVKAEELANNSIHYEYWNSLGTEDIKSRYLIQAFTVIVKLRGIILPETNEPCLAQAQMDIVLNDLRYGFSAANALSNQEVAEESAVTGTHTKYFKSDAGAQLPEYIPASVWTCLTAYGAIQPSTFCGIATLDKVREY